MKEGGRCGGKGRGNGPQWRKAGGNEGKQEGVVTKGRPVVVGARVGVVMEEDRW